MKRTLQDWANLAAIIGNAGLIVSLGFVGFQIADSTQEMRATTAYQATAALQTWYNEVGTNEQAASLFRRGMNDPSSLSKDEALQFLMNIHSVMLAYQSIYFLGTEGTLDASLYKAMASTLEAAVPTPGFTWYWAQRGGHFTDEFKGFVDKIIATQPGGGAEIYR
jgi:hypothetical protein